MAYQFSCHGPFLVPTTKKKVGKEISKKNVEEFWTENNAYKNAVGCYIFGMRAGRGITPVYVGKATKGFVQEIFSADKLNKYRSALSDYMRGNPVLFFLNCPTKKGPTNFNYIKELEKILIQQASLSNPKLINIHHKKIPAWGIAGVLRSDTKKPSKSAASVRLLLGVR